MGNKRFIAHIQKNDKKKIQYLTDHLLNVGGLSKKFAKKTGLENTAYLAGVLHDAGKFSDAFFEYIIDVGLKGKQRRRGEVAHAIYGGKLVYELFDEAIGASAVTAAIISNAIFSHHRSKGLIDYVTPQKNSPFMKRLKINVEEEKQVFTRFYKNCMDKRKLQCFFQEARKEIITIQKKHPEQESLVFYISKYIYSCLLDADRTDTRNFELGTDSKKIDYTKIYECCQKKFNQQIFSKGNFAINALRQEMSDQVFSKAASKNGVYSLSIPTGGGKTLTSFRYGLEHAIENQFDHIIFILPFNVVLEQNAKEIRKLLPDARWLLEHHSNVVTFSEEKKLEERDENENPFDEMTQAVLEDTWETPIIFTSMVRFLEIVFGSGTKNPRRFHHLTNSLLIFDEIQALPIKTTKLFTSLINYLTTVGNSSILLSTATQPEFGVLQEESLFPFELLDNYDKYAGKLERTELVVKSSEVAYDLKQMTSFINSVTEMCKTILVIVNTKKVAYDIFQKINVSKISHELFLLTTDMCPAHREAVITQLKKNLKYGRLSICISTQLIEAGVDISFDCVIRSLAGLASLIQSAGRCNRNSTVEDEKKPIYLVELDSDWKKTNKLTDIEVGKEIVKSLLKQGRPLFSREMVRQYYKRLLRERSLDVGYPVKGYGDLFDMTKIKPYKAIAGSFKSLYIHSAPQTIADHFNVIDDYKETVIVPYKEGKNVIVKLTSAMELSQKYEVLKQAQKYSIQMSISNLEKICQQGGVARIELAKNHCVNILLENFYDEKLGLRIDGNSKIKSLIMG